MPTSASTPSACAVPGTPADHQLRAALRGVRRAVASRREGPALAHRQRRRRARGRRDRHQRRRELLLLLDPRHDPGPPRRAPDSAYVAVERVEVTTVAALAEKFAVEPARTLLKIDTQGYEAEVMAGAGDLLGRFDGMQLEVSFVELYEGQQLAEQTIAVLREHGYRLQSLETGFSDPTGRLLQCDVLVVRDH
ncbi:FkbM family methyltransferase [Nocardioides kongjuensis]|uniref:FkbM family methyltransferase n=1 Tax=Nocardioides kongjuensis TaxID=349522 RepID=UPI0031E7240D